MKTSSLVSILSLSFSLAAVQPVWADDGAESGGADGKRHHRSMRGEMHVRKFVLDYMVEAGDIDQAEIDEIKAQNKVDRAELKALKAAGDDEGFEIRKAELKAQRGERRAEMKAYVEAHEDLKGQWEAKRSEMKAKRQARREHHGERHGERQESGEEGDVEES